MNPELKRYIPIVDMIAETFGSDCEVIIHDLANPEKSIVYIANSGVTQRKIGDSFTGNFISDVLISDQIDGDYVSNYRFGRDLSKLIKSSTALIRDDKENIIGAICINFSLENLNKGFNAINNLIGPLYEERFEAPSPNIMKGDVQTNQNINIIVKRIVDHILDGVDTENLTRSERVQYIRFMEERDIFSIKGMVEDVADRMGISKVTVYSYLDEIRCENNEIY